MQEMLPLWKDPEGDGQPLAPGEYIRRELIKRGWGQAELAAVIDRPLPAVNEIIKGKRALTSEMAVALGRAFNTPADLWAHREAAYRLSLVRSADSQTSKLARLYEVAPIKDMQRRGWINPDAQTAELLAAELIAFMGGDPLSEMQVPAALAKQTFSATEFSNAQRAWLIQASRLARQLNVRTYSHDALQTAMPALRKLAAKPELAAKLPIALAELGVRFVAIEDLPRTRIDGAAFFLDGDQMKPVVAISLRLDRMIQFPSMLIWLAKGASA
jgi:HTH-type transcriptional regulator / antitoxin HigA